jgi:hypothetical protein
MKPLLYNKLTRIPLPYGMIAAICFLISISVSANDENDSDRGKKKEAKTTTGRFALNNKSVKIYPDLIRREMHVVSKEKNETVFFVFDLEGTLVINRPVKQGEHFKITGLNRGHYTFHLFEGDEEKASGKFEIR